MGPCPEKQNLISYTDSEGPDQPVTSLSNITPNKKSIQLNKHQKDCLWKQRTQYGLENGSLGFIETLHKQ